MLRRKGRQRIAALALVSVLAAALVIGCLVPAMADEGNGRDGERAQQLVEWVMHHVDPAVIAWIVNHNGTVADFFLTHLDPDTIAAIINGGWEQGMVLQDLLEDIYP